MAVFTRPPGAVFPRKGKIVYQIAYVLLSPFAMLTVQSSVGTIFPKAFYYAFFLGPALLYARSRRSAEVLFPERTSVPPRTGVA